MLKFDKNQDIPRGVTKDMISVQEVIDILQNIAKYLPKGRTLENVPFGIRLSNGNPLVFHDRFKDKLLLVLLGKSYAHFLNLVNTDGYLVYTKDKFFQEVKEIKKENAIMKDKLSKIELMSKNATCDCGKI